MTYNGWRETANGNWVWIEDGVRATVFLNKDDEWGAIWNGADDGQARLLKGSYDTAEEAIEAVEEADAEGDDSPKWYPPDDQWIESKKRVGSTAERAARSSP